MKPSRNLGEFLAVCDGLWYFYLLAYSWKRNDLVISTKIYWGGANGDNPVNNGGLSRKHIVEGLDASLKRLQLDYGKLVFAT